MKTLPTTRRLLASTAPLILCAVPLTGCGSSWFGAGDDPVPAVQPGDFVGDPRPEQPESEDTGQPLVATDTSDEQEQTPGNPTVARSGQALAVNAMVGHINSEAVYADQIFNIDIAAQLESFGRRFEAEEFGQQASRVINERLRSVILDKLILGEAERNLKKQQRLGIDARVQSEREEMIRFYGQGSTSKAKAEFKKDRGQDMDEYLIARRDELSIGFYIQSRVSPKIVVNRRDIERWYEDNKSQYQQPDQRIIRLIRVMEKEEAASIKRQLDNGASFETLASDGEVNTYNAAGSGMFNGGKPVPGDKIIKYQSVNDAILKLEKGAHAGPFEVEGLQYFVELVQYEPGVTVPLTEAQLQIKNTLRAVQFERYARRLRTEIFKRGSFSDPEEMGAKLLEIARARYDR